MEGTLHVKQEVPSDDEADADASMEEAGDPEMGMVIGPEFVKVSMETDSDDETLFQDDDNSNDDDMECWLPNRQNNQRKVSRGAKTRHYANLKCNLCGREDFRRAIDLARHTTAHSWVRSQVCSVCGKAYIYWKSLKRHMARGHPTVDKETLGFGADKKLAKTKHTSEEDMKNHTCFMCQAKFNREAKLRNHFQTAHGFTILDSAAIVKKNRRQRRKMSDSQQETSGVNNNHRAFSQRRQLSCNHCGLLFARTSQLLQHRVIHQDRGASFTCGNCGKDLPNLASLRSHFCPSRQQLQLLQQTSTITITPIINNNNNSNKRQHIQENNALRTETLNLESGGLPPRLASELEVTRLHHNSSQPAPKPSVVTNSLKPRDVRRQELEVTCLSGEPQSLEQMQHMPEEEEGSNNPQLAEIPQAPLPLVKVEADVRPLPEIPASPPVLVHKEVELRYLPEAHYPQVSHGPPSVKRELEVMVLEAHQQNVPKEPSSQVQGLDLSIKVKREVD